MAFFYYTYDTTIGNTLISGATGSSAPLPSGLSEIFIDFEPKYKQPLFLYRESGGTIVGNTDANVVLYEEKYNPPEPTDFVTQLELSGETVVTNQRFTNIEEFVGYNPTGTTNVITVDKSGGEDFVSVKEAVDSITGSTVDNPWLVYVNAGIYDENPFIIPPYVTIEGIGSTIAPLDENNPLITASGNTTLREIGLQTPNTSFAVDVVGSDVKIGSIDVTGSGNGVRMTDVSGVTVNDGIFRTGLANSLTIDNSVVELFNVDAVGSTSILATNFAYVNMTDVITSGVYGIDMTNNAIINFNNIRIPSATIGVRLTNGANISGYGSAWKFAGGTQPTLSANTDVLTCVSDGTSLYTAALADFS